MKILCLQVVAKLLGGDIDYAKVLKLTTQSGLNSSDVKAVVAALHFIILNAAKYNVDERQLSNELTQLGLPQANSQGLTRPYQQSLERLRAKFGSDTLQVSKLESVDWRVDYLLGSSSVSELQVPSLQLSLGLAEAGDGVGAPAQNVAFEMSDSKFQLLLNELRAARAMMDTLE